MSTTLSQAQDEHGPLQPDLSSNAITVLEDRYLVRDDDGHVIETPERTASSRCPGYCRSRGDLGNFDRGSVDESNRSSINSWRPRRFCRIRPR